MDFRNKKQPDKSFSIGKFRFTRKRSPQSRVITLVFAFALVLVLMQQASNPENFRRLFGDRQTTSRSLHQDQTGSRDRQPGSTQSNGESVVAFQGEPRQNSELFPGSEPASEYFPGVHTFYLTQIRDNSPSRKVEHDAWFNLMDVLRSASQEELDGAALPNVSYVQLKSQPDEYRGKLVTLTGTVKRSLDFDISGQGRSVTNYYQLWLAPAEGPAEPIIINSLELPAGFPSSRGEGNRPIDFSERVTVTGFFFKNLAFQAVDEMRSAPQLLAKTVTWHRRPPAEVVTVNYKVLLLVVMGMALLAVLFTLWVYYSSADRDPHLKALEARFETEPENFDHLAEMDLGEDMGAVIQKTLSDSEEE